MKISGKDQSALYSEPIFCTVNTPLGEMLAAASAGRRPNANNAAICGLWFTDQKYFPDDTDGWIYQPDNPVFIKLKAWLDSYFSKKKKLPPLPLAPAGTAFQQSVWSLLRAIPCGATCTYGDIAKKIAGNKAGNSLTVRAVAGAIGHNPISIIIPCHRVIGADGTLKGYAGGIERKKALLDLES